MIRHQALDNHSAANALYDRAPLRGPAFSTYGTDEVAWLLTDLSEAVTYHDGNRDGAHYRDGVVAELAPATYEPSVEYKLQLAAATDRHAAQTAYAVGVLTEAILQRASDATVVVSIMRAGVPVGVLMHRWAASIRGVDLPHYAISIVQEAGIDPNALRWLAYHHAPANVVFVDGWTAKGTVAIIFEQCVQKAASEWGAGFSTTLGVLADPGRCTPLYGTREDFLIPSAGLDSAACGLVSRSVFHPELTGQNSFHGAAFHCHLVALDASRAFVDTVTAHFEDVARDLSRNRPTLCGPDWTGRRTAELIARQYHLDHIDLVKPGVCETTRVLVQWRVDRLLIRRSAKPDLDHVLVLADERQTSIEYVDDLPFSCVALVPPRPVLASATPMRPYR